MSLDQQQLTQPSVDGLPQDVLVDLAYVARQARRAHPRGRFDNAGRFYPSSLEGECPSVRSPSRAYPYSYMTACRTRRHCAQLPPDTLREDAMVGLQYVLAGGEMSAAVSRRVAGALSAREEV